VQPAPTILFDLDGPLIDTARDLVTALNVVIATEGLAPVDFESASMTIGNGAKAMLQSAFTADGRAVTSERLETLMLAFIDHYTQHIADHSQPFPGTEAMLDRFAAEGWRLAICTNKLEPLARSLLDQLGLSWRFATIAGQDTFGFKKPDPRLLFETVRLAGGVPQHAIMVGDSGFDIDAAKAAAMPVIAVTFGYSPIPVAELGADAVIDHLDRLWEVARLLMPKVPSP
jgi:phosphoglycolate phosphatase